MKKFFALILTAFVLTGTVFAEESCWDKSVGLDVGFVGLKPNFYTQKNHLEMQAGLTFMTCDAFSDNMTLSPEYMIGWTVGIFDSPWRFSLGVSDRFITGYNIDEESFGLGNLFSMYLRFSYPIDEHFEVAGLGYVPLNYIYYDFKSGTPDIGLPGYGLLSKCLPLLTFEVRYYLGGL